MPCGECGGEAGQAANKGGLSNRLSLRATRLTPTEALWETTQHTPHTQPTTGVREQGWVCGHTSFHQSQAQWLSAASGECSFPGTSNLTG